MAPALADTDLRHENGGRPFEMDGLLGKAVYGGSDPEYIRKQMIENATAARRGPLDQKALDKLDAQRETDVAVQRLAERRKYPPPRER